MITGIPATTVTDTCPNCNSTTIIEQRLPTAVMRECRGCHFTWVHQWSNREEDAPVRTALSPGVAIKTLKAQLKIHRGAVEQAAKLSPFPADLMQASQFMGSLFDLLNDSVTNTDRSMKLLEAITPKIEQLISLLDSYQGLYKTTHEQLATALEQNVKLARLVGEYGEMLDAIDTYTR